MSAAIDALKQVLRGALDSVHVFDYGSASGFEKLWQFNDLSKPVLIVWGRTIPDGVLWPIDASACLSPLDWAAAYARHRVPVQTQEDGEAASKENWPKILILDADPAAHTKVPTLTHYRTLRPEQLPWLTVPESPNLKNICEWLKPTPLTVESTTQKSLDRFLREIRLNLIEVRTEGDYDRHAISNIIAPMVLLGRSVTESRHSSALERLIKAVGLYGKASASDPPRDPNSTQQDAITHTTGLNATDDSEGKSFPEVEMGEDLSVLLLDDQEQHGWTEWLKQCLKKATAVTAHRSPDALVDAIEQQMRTAATSGAKDVRFRFQLPGLAETANPVLFLDLRLFSGDQDAELAFYRDRLLPLIDDYFLDRDDMAWPSFSSAPTSAFSVARSKITCGGFELESPEHHEALTWLPRILALADMSLPVVIFSSTGRRYIAQKLSEFGNLIVQSAKPRFHEGSGSAGWSEEAMQDLPISLTRVRNLLCGRKRGRQALACERLNIPGLNRNGINHFELYIDESLDGPRLIVGGLFAGFASSADAQYFDDCLVSKGVRYFESNGVGPQPPQVKSKTRPCKTEFEAVVNQWRTENRPLLLGLITLDGIEPFTTPLRFLDMDFMDNRWRLGVEAIVELFLSEVVGKRAEGAGQSPPSVGIYAPTRVSPANSKREARINQAKFGTTVQKMDEGRKWGNNAVSESNLLPIACNIIRNHSLNVDLLKAKYIRLQYEPRDCREWEIDTGDDALVCWQGPNAPSIPAQLQCVEPDLGRWRTGLKALHYVCDQLLRDLQRINQPGWSDFTNASPCLHDAFDRFLRGNVAASRFLDTDRVVEALVAWRPHSFIRPAWRKGVRSASDCIGRRLSDSLLKLTGPEFEVVCQRLSAFSSVPRQQPTTPRLRPPSATAPQASKVTIPDAAELRPGLGDVVTSRYFVRIDDLKDQVTAQGLLEAATVGNSAPLGCQLADDAINDLRTAIVYYPNESDPLKVATSLRRRGWTVTPFIASPTVCLPENSQQDDGPVDPEVVDEVDKAPLDRWSTPHVLRVGPVPDSLDFKKLVDRVKENFHHVKVIERLRAHRNSTKFVVDFSWPVGSGAEIGIESIQCGDELVPVELLNDVDDAVDD